jgi:lipoprotein-releasing system ATP-binding protein
VRVVADRLGHSFRQGENLFEDVSFDLGPGSLTAITGPSGSGKSTLLSVLAGWTEPTSGRIARQGSGSTAWVFQNPAGVARRTVLDHVALPYLARGFTRADAQIAANADLVRFGLDSRASAQFRYLSGGEAQRLMLARATATRPALLLVDEPTAQLDRSSAARVVDYLVHLSEEDRVVVVSTHDDAVRDVCGRVIDLGRRVR